jgi:hypothetical protein
MLTLPLRFGEAAPPRRLGIQSLFGLLQKFPNQPNTATDSITVGHFLGHSFRTHGQLPTERSKGLLTNCWSHYLTKVKLLRSNLGPARQCRIRRIHMHYEFQLHRLWKLKGRED